MFLQGKYELPLVLDTFIYARLWFLGPVSYALATVGVNLLGAISGPLPGAVRVSLRLWQA